MVFDRDLEFARHCRKMREEEESTVFFVIRDCGLQSMEGWKIRRKEQRTRVMGGHLKRSRERMDELELVMVDIQDQSESAVHHRARA